MACSAFCSDGTTFLYWLIDRECCGWRGASHAGLLEFRCLALQPCYLLTQLRAFLQCKHWSELQNPFVTSSRGQASAPAHEAFPRPQSFAKHSEAIVLKHDSYNNHLHQEKYA
eukprot:2930857-Amphidinium_carterae.1